MLSRTDEFEGSRGVGSKQHESHVFYIHMISRHGIHGLTGRFLALQERRLGECYFFSGRDMLAFGRYPAWLPGMFTGSLGLRVS